MYIRIIGKEIEQFKEEEFEERFEILIPDGPKLILNFLRLEEDTGICWPVLPHVGGNPFCIPCVYNFFLMLPFFKGDSCDLILKEYAQNQSVELLDTYLDTTRRGKSLL